MPTFCCISSSFISAFVRCFLRGVEAVLGVEVPPSSCDDVAAAELEAVCERVFLGDGAAAGASAALLPSSA